LAANFRLAELEVGVHLVLAEDLAELGEELALLEVALEHWPSSAAQVPLRFAAGSGYLNLIARPAGQGRSGWGRVVFYVADVDALYRRVLALKLCPDTSPQDAPWGERYFHLTDPDGHELSFARRPRPADRPG
jgi:catechol 2,3-dioxygenase-like lactoylglutathione lyase family enzyme